MGASLHPVSSQAAPSGDGGAGSDGVSQSSCAGAAGVVIDSEPGDRGCILGRRLLWTYHVNMRLAGRHITRAEILAAAERYELVESYPDDKYLPSYLVSAVQPTGAFHVLFAVDVDADHADNRHRLSSSS